MLLSQSDQLVGHYLLLDTPLDDAPQSFNRIQLWTIRRQKHQLQVKIDCEFSNFFRMMWRVIVKYHIHLLVWINELLSQQRKKLDHILLVGGITLHEDWLRKTGTDGTKDSDPLPTQFRKSPLHWIVCWSPSAVVPHPQVKRWLIEVNERFVFFYQPCQMQSKGVDRSFWTIGRLTVGETHDSISNVVLQVKLSERILVDWHSFIQLQLKTTLLERQVGPLLHHCIAE